MTNNTPSDFYKVRINTYSKKFETLKEKANRISGIRIISFLLGIVLIYITATISSNAVMVASGLFVIVFGYIVFHHNNIHKQKNYTEILLKINTAEFQYLQGNYEAFKDGKEYNLPEHSFADDLDLFGKNSLFHSINRCSTFIGSDKLASWFLNLCTNKTQIEEKQIAIKELSLHTEWRQEFQTKGYLTKENREDQSDIEKWVKSETGFSKPIYKSLIIVFPILTFLLLTLSIFNIIPEQIFYLYILIPLAISYGNFKRVNKIHILLGKKTDLLKKYAGLLKKLENQSFESSYLNKIMASSSHEIEKPSRILSRLSKISSAFDNRLNMIGGFLLNVFLLWDILQSIRLDNWKKKYGYSLSGWFETISEFDALNSLANFHFNHPENNFPIISNKEFHIEAKELGHPLILQSQRVDNDITFKGWKNFVIITGANMAGKSTFLRTLGVNMVLASTGSSICTKYFEWTPVEIFTSLRTKDSLDKNESYFYAELKRLKTIIDQLNNGQNTFIILDEILKGTNSKDKQSGSMQLIKQLIGLNASGIIATHDLILGDLIKTYPENITNKCFEVDIIKDKLVFDYKLRDGISQNMNATFLMKKMGITV
jgi:DNA mismatch repair ATPase MutS